MYRPEMKQPAAHQRWFVKIKRDLAVIKLMLGINLTAVAFLAIKTFA
jgi:hypothetical protein